MVVEEKYLFLNKESNAEVFKASCIIKKAGWYIRNSYVFQHT